MNSVAKGNRMERLLLAELQEYIKNNGDKVIAAWKTNRSHFSANDLYTAWDCAILSMDKNLIRTQWLVQVKSIYSSEELTRLREFIYGNCYLAVYGREPKEYTIKLKHFWLILV